MGILSPLPGIPQEQPEKDCCRAGAERVPLSQNSNTKGTISNPARSWIGSSAPEQPMTRRKDKAIGQTNAVRSRSPARLDASAARLRAAEYCLFHYPTLYTAGVPRAVSQDNVDCWLVPIVLSSPARGEMGVVGELRLDARTGEVLQGTDRSKVVAAGAGLYKGKKRNDRAPATSPGKRR